MDNDDFIKTKSTSTLRFAFVTFMIRDDGYLPGALLYGYALRAQQTKADIICLVSREISEHAIFTLKHIYDYVLSVDEIYVDNINKRDRTDLPYLFTRFHALRLGRNGDLGIGYDKIVVCDSDVLPIRHYDDLFLLNTPAGILNEKPEYFLRYDEYGCYVVPETAYEKGEWAWHKVYNPICPHGQRIPAYITDRVQEDIANMGVNSVLYVLQPDYNMFKKILEDISNKQIQDIISKFRWPEMQYLTMAWSGMWYNIDLRFSGFKGYPDYKVLYGIHYAGNKPWRINDRKTMKNRLKFPDVIIWYVYYLEMIRRYPLLLNTNRLKKLYTIINIPQIQKMADYFLKDL